MFSFITPFALKRSGILGMNSRNIEFISRYNNRKLFPLVDNKLQTKLLANEYGINTPELLFVMQYQHDVYELKEKLKDISCFAIKPACGSGGKGILVIKGREGEGFVKSSGMIIEVEEVIRHVTNILAGLYSLSGDQDVALVETLIEADTVFDDYSYQGVPDIRIIVFQGYPVMAMLRLSTKDSDGKANLHQGAVGVGLDIKTGKPINAVMNGKKVLIHPDTKHSFDTIKIENWRELLLLASSCYDMTNLGYLGADIVLDKNRGAMLLELNARPGLSIQVANSKGLLPRLREIEKVASKRTNVQKRVDFVLEKEGF
ncbi:MAG: alpha-L-glutamate ligase-like protein [Sulfurimonas sp.]|uniref:alpha-L-glutamate ligase-like protein n=1 Tax=Sulfurimonas sp. TaxID=2022749 RepID=UPI0025D74DE6|nr:alpha-L-glutamate ligase-like protein [Sulfurimonas sp.]MCK9492126.1 alpha-L-glutamate ligase-like protein [Sulfurimonas sp.]